MGVSGIQGSTSRCRWKGGACADWLSLQSPADMVTYVRVGWENFL